MSQGEGGGAPLGNKFRVALKDPGIRQQAYQSYCDHLAKGKSKKSWYFEHEELSCTWETMEKYIKNEDEFDPSKKIISESKGLAVWEQVVEDGAIGRNKDHNTATLQMLMRNKFGWDKAPNKNEDLEGKLDEPYKALINQLNEHQEEARKRAEINVKVEYQS